MTSQVTDYGRDFYLGCLFGAFNLVPASYWLALTRGAPDPSTDGTTLSVLEPPNTTGYARVLVTNNATMWGAPAGGVSASIAPITFPLASADWGVIDHYALCDAQTAGNVYLTGTLQLPRYIGAGHLAQFDSGLLTVGIYSIHQPVIA